MKLLRKNKPCLLALIGNKRSLGSFIRSKYLVSLVNEPEAKSNSTTLYERSREGYRRFKAGKRSWYSNLRPIISLIKLKISLANIGLSDNKNQLSRQNSRAFSVFMEKEEICA